MSQYKINSFSAEDDTHTRVSFYITSDESSTVVNRDSIIENGSKTTETIIEEAYNNIRVEAEEALAKFANHGKIWNPSKKELEEDTS